ncbi:hypothetical protein RCG19_12010 [Neobacillus sp. OS1-2]|uniref:hypothetical protein n=1 Tax=Neobacillus sp. OS1-2 TaxID=3070680 RepID=UPI0027E0994F|nr:hypothetical protein [Neobacillus sp. OS1-2]WML37973.1 hypothetical protein RCG19_12010 [Neobacillus sp. OS1-2]
MNGYFDTKKLINMEEYYYWVGYKDWFPFPSDLKEKLLKVYGEEPFQYEWTEQDIHEGARKIIIEFFKA